MTDSSATQPPGWYYAQGDPPGTQRYWDGSQWVGGPQAAQGGVEAGAGGFQPSGGGAAGVPAEFGSRFIAWLIDVAATIGVFIGLFIIAAIMGAINDTLGGIFVILAYLGYLGFTIWNLAIRQGQTGQTIGKSQQNIKLVADATGQPVGAGMAFVRWLLASAISTVTCGIAGLLDYLWPLWDEDKKRLTDKIINFSVVNA